MSTSSSPDSMKTGSTILNRTAQLTRHLSSAAMATTSQSAAPWRAAFLQHLDSMSEQSFTLSTLHPIATTPPQETENYVPPVCPRARTVIYRGMWADMPVNSKNPAELNPKNFESDLLTLTSDARMEKVPEMLASFGSSGVAQSKESQSGRGGPVEAVFWMNEVKTQWRIRGHSYIIGPDIDSSAHTSVREALKQHMRPTSQDASSTKTENVPQDASFSFSRELTAHFGNLSPGMRGSFKNPPPGTPLSRKPGEGEGLGQKVQGVDDEVARRNFRVVVVVPEEVDQVDLSDPSEGKRWNYKVVGDNEEGRMGAWKVTEMWP